MKLTVAMAGFLWLLYPSYGQMTLAQQPDPRSTVGEVSPLIPMQSAEAVHMGLVRRLPAQAIQGIYMLFVLNRQRVPSMAKRVDLKEEHD